MNIYKLTPKPKASRPYHSAYDYYDSCVVVAYCAEQAKLMNPQGRLVTDDSNLLFSEGWESPENINAQLIGVADDKEKNRRVICASFNRG